MSNFQDDRRFLLAAARLARRGLGRVWPNPSVGALIVREDGAGRPVVVSHGVTGRPGTGHAEARALAAAGALAKGGSCYVTLEPCSHFGRTPPCSLALVEAGVSRVVIGVRDPNPRVAGRGIAMLQQAGVEVITGIADAECWHLHAGFISRITRGRPRVTLKLAVSSDGFIGRQGGKPGQAQVRLTGAVANAQVHALRASHDAIMVGIGTALADDPALTCRLPGMAERSPVRVILDSQGQLPLRSALVQSAAEVPVWVVASAAAPAQRLRALSAAGVLVIKVPALKAGGLDPAAALAALGARGMTSVLLEGGARVADTFERAGLIDEALIIRAPAAIGAGGISPFGGRALETVLSAPNYERHGQGAWGADQYTEIRRQAEFPSP